MEIKTNSSIKQEAEVMSVTIVGTWMDPIIFYIKEGDNSCRHEISKKVGMPSNKIYVD